MTSSHQPKPLICTFVQLSRALQALHLGQKAELDRLHDIWSLGAPTPDSRLLLPTYDPRKVEPGNYEARIVFPSKLAEWVLDVAKRRGYACTPQQAQFMTEAVAGILNGEIAVEQAKKLKIRGKRPRFHSRSKR